MNRIKKIREELGLTQQELADKLDCAKSTIAMYENETRKPSLEILVKLSEIFNCSIDYLLGKTEVRNPRQQEEIAWLSEFMQKYVPPSEKQKKQLLEIMKIILKDN